MIRLWGALAKHPALTPAPVWRKSPPPPRGVGVPSVPLAAETAEELPLPTTPPGELSTGDGRGEGQSPGWTAFRSVHGCPPCSDRSTNHPQQKPEEVLQSMSGAGGYQSRVIHESYMSYMRSMFLILTCLSLRG